MSFADSLDCVGVMARDVKTVRRVFGQSCSIRLVFCFLLKIKIDVASKYDPKDPTSSLPEVRERAQALSAEHSLPHSGLTASSLEGLRIGIPQVLSDLFLISTLKNDHQLSLSPGVLPHFNRPLHSYPPSASSDIPK